ncbi:hypothetical protein CSOJ01_15956 [Colletotrichum sojae]|uniref:Uncharacterized protein n=1 Tax=Colletotrichum sojae TaxID=2175907 RepID=A0A8H6MIA8_9PEZI|nr:hypothetical protein CSOJ01_15956 [Colletotrichum sojae]
MSPNTITIAMFWAVSAAITSLLLPCLKESMARPQQQR